MCNGERVWRCVSRLLPDLPLMLRWCSGPVLALLSSPFDTYRHASETRHRQLTTINQCRRCCLCDTSNNHWNDSQANDKILLNR